MAATRIIMGIDPGLAHTGWGVVHQKGASLSCVAYGCVATQSTMPLHERLAKIYTQISAVVLRYRPECVAVETVWFGSNAQSAFATGQARGAALTACGQASMALAEYSPSQIKLAVVGAGSADKGQVQYMVQQLLGLEKSLRPIMLPMPWRLLFATQLIRFPGKGGLCGDFVFARNDCGTVR